MYKDKVLQKEAVKRAVQKHRGITKGITSEGITKGMTDAVVLALGDDAKREKLERICVSLKKHNVLEDVRYGYYGPTFYGIAKTLGIA